MNASAQGCEAGFSIVIPTYNEEANIERCLSAIRDAQHSAEITSLDIHVIDNCSTDNTVKRATEYKATIHIMPHRVSIAKLRNHGARLSTSNVLLFLDADMEVPPDWLQVLQRYFDCGRADVLGFVEHIPQRAPWLAKAWCNRVLARRSKVTEVDYLPGRNLACRRSFFERVDGFDETMVTAEDKDFVMRLKRAGARVISDPNLEILHWGYERSLTELARKEFWRQSNNLNLIQRHGRRWRLLRFPLISIAHVAWGVLVAGVLLSGQFIWALLGLVAWFGPSLITALAWRLSRRFWLYVLQLTFLNWMRYNIAGVAVICEFVRRMMPGKSAQRVTG